MEHIITEPLSMKYMVQHTTENDAHVHGNILVSMDEIMNSDVCLFQDIVSMKLSGTSCLLDINYTPVGAKDGMIVMQVSGDAYGILRMDESMYDELKSALFAKGRKALEDFTGMDLSDCRSDDEIEIHVDHAAGRKDENEMINLYRKYVPVEEPKK